LPAAKFTDGKFYLVETYFIFHWILDDFGGNIAEATSATAAIGSARASHADARGCRVTSKFLLWLGPGVWRKLCF
jgi:hypothetical protein